MHCATTIKGRKGFEDSSKGSVFKRFKMKLRIQYAGGLCTHVYGSKVPSEGEIYDGEIVEEVNLHDPPRNGFAAYVYIRVSE